MMEKMKKNKKIMKNQIKKKLWIFLRNNQIKKNKRNNKPIPFHLLQYQSRKVKI